MAGAPSEDKDETLHRGIEDEASAPEGISTRQSSERSDRRGHRRHAVANLRVKGPVTGDVLNASHLGMAIETHDSLKVGWSYAFKMRNGPEVIRIPGRVQWCRLVELLRVGENEFLPVFRMGVHLAGNIWSKPQSYYYP